MKRVVLMLFVLTGTLSVSLPAHAYYCTEFDKSQACVNQREQEARTEYMKQEAKLMEERRKMLEKCNDYNPPSYCR